MASNPLTEMRAQEFRRNMSSLKAKRFAHRSHLQLNEDRTASLGPWIQTITETQLQNYHNEVRQPILAFRRDAASFDKWQKHHQAVQMGIWPNPSEEEVAWYETRKIIDSERWQRVGIAETLELCFSLDNGGGNRAPIIAATCFWNTSSNTFDFKFGQMGITLLDVLTIIGLPIDPEPYSHGDYDRASELLQFLPSPDRSPHNESYSAWCAHFSKLENEGSGIAFLEFWLCKFLFCTQANKITGSWTMLAAALFNGHRTGLGQSVLASLYRSLYHLSLKPFKYKLLGGPLWMLDLWLQVYFPQFRHPDVTFFLEDQLLGMAFAKKDKFDPPSYSECFKYLYNLDESALDSVTLVLNRKFPHILEHGFFWTRFHSRQASDTFTQAISCNDFNLSCEEAGFELYAPNHFTRQFGFIQEPPFPLFESLNRYTSWRITKSQTAADDEKERYTVPFKLVSMAAVPIVEVHRPSRHASAPYVVWWQKVSAGWRYEAEDVFRSIFQKGKALLNSEVDRRVLKGEDVPEPAFVAKKLKQKATATGKECRKRTLVIDEDPKEEQPLSQKRKANPVIEITSNSPSAQNETREETITSSLADEENEEETRELYEALDTQGMLPVTHAEPIPMAFEATGKRAQKEQASEPLKETGPAPPEQDENSLRQDVSAPQCSAEPSPLAITNFQSSGEAANKEISFNPTQQNTPHTALETEVAPANRELNTNADVTAALPRGQHCTQTEVLDLGTDPGYPGTETKDDDAESNGVPVGDQQILVYSDMQTVEPASGAAECQIPELPTQVISEMNNPSSSNQNLDEDERLNQLLQPEFHSEAVETAKYFLGKLGAVNPENPEITGKIRECIGILKPYASEEELTTLSALEARMDAIPSLQTAIATSSTFMHQQIAQRTALQQRFNAFKERLEAQRTSMVACNEELAELEAAKAEIEKKIARLQNRKVELNGHLSKELSATEELKQALDKAKTEVRKATLANEDKVVELQRTSIDIASLGRRL